MSRGTTRSESCSLGLVLAMALALCVGAVPSAEAETITWANLAGGTWNTAANWNPADVPNEAGEEALVIDDGGTYTITLNVSPGLDALAIQNPTATLNLGSSTLTLLQSAGLSNAGRIQANSGSATITGAVFNQSAGTIQTLNNCDLYFPGQTLFNDGTIKINALAGTGNSNLIASGNVILEGGGVLRMVTSGQVNDAELETGSGFTLTQQVTHSIRGAGTINAALVNYGTVMADESGRTLWLTANPKSNDGTMGAVAGCYLNLGPTTLTQGPGGRLLGDEGAVRLESGATIVGGTFASNGAGKVTTVTGGPVTIEDIRNLGRFDVIPATVHLRGTLTTNDGTITLNPAGSANNSVLTFIEDLTLSGSGQCVMVAATDANDARVESSAGVTGTNGPGHTIRGSGTISAALVNEGLISGDDTVRALDLITNPKTNAGTLQAVAGGRLNVTGCAVTQDPGGTILADNALVGLGDGSTITGGTLASSGAGRVTTISGTTTIEDIHNLSRLDVIPATVNLRGTLVTNDGTITLNPGGSANNSFLVFVEDATLGGSGECLMVAATASNDANIQTAAGITGTNGPGHTIRGSGTISAALANEGLISGDDTVRSLDLTTNPKTNAGTLQAAAGGRLNITGCTVAQDPGGTILADNAVVGLGAGGTVTGGVLASANGGAVRSDAGTATLGGVTNIGTLQILGNGSSITVNGSSFANEGLIAVNYSGISNNATLRFADTCTLTGAGEVFLRVGGSSISDAVISTLGDAVLTVGADQLIHGSGELSARMVNQGTIVADDPTWDLTCNSDDLINHGVMRAEDGGDLLISDGTLINLATVAAIDASRILVSAAGFLRNQGQITATDEGLLWVSSSSGQLVNDGSITAGPMGHFHVTNGSVKNYGTVRAEAQGAVWVDYGTYWSEGLTAVSADGSFWSDRMQVSGNYSGSTLTGGTWQVEAGGIMRLIDCNVQTLKAGAVLIGPGATIYSNEGSTDALAGLTSIQAGGHLEVRAGRDYATPGNLTNAFGGLTVGAGCAFAVLGQYTQTGNGEIDRGVACIDGTLDTNAGTLAISSGTLCGSGTILDDVNSGGWVKPGSLSGSLVGTLAVAGSFVQSPGGTFDVQLGGTGTGESDVLQVSGQASLAGRLIVRSIEGYTPQVGDRFTILACGARTGEFAVETGCPGLGLIYDTFYYADRVEIEILGDASAVAEPELAGEPQEPGEEAEPAAPGASDPAAEDPGNGAGQAGTTKIPTAVSLTARPLGGGAAALELALPESAEIDLRLYDLNGRQVAIVARGFEAAGVHDYALSGERFRGRGLPAGIYLAAVRIRSASETLRTGTRVVLIR